MQDLKSLTDESLLQKTDLLVRKERELLTAILHHLLEIERRRLFCGYPSLFAYAVGHLGYSEDQAYRRIAAMRLFREIPEIEIGLEQGEVTLTHIGIAQSIFTNEKKCGREFTPEKKLEMFEAMAGHSTREAQKIALGFAPEATIKKDEIRPVAEGLNLAKFGLSDETLAKLEKVRGRLAHKNPNPSMDELISATCDAYLEQTDPAKEPKRKVKRDTDAAISRAIWKRDDGACTQCGSTHAVQEDHILPESMASWQMPSFVVLGAESSGKSTLLERVSMFSMFPRAEGKLGVIEPHHP